MSLYIGSNGGEKILHIYNNSSNIEKNIFSGTSFHSSLPYLIFRSIHTFTPTGVNSSGGNNYITWEKKGFSTSNPLPSGNFSVILRGYYNDIIYTFPTTIGDGYINGVEGWHYGHPATAAPCFHLSDTSNGYSIRCDVHYGQAGDAPYFEVALFDKIDILVLDPSIVPIIPTSVKITNKELLVNNSSILGSQYIHYMTSLTDRINDYDTIIPIPIGGTNTRAAYTKTTSNLTHSVVNGTMSYIQIINSYNYPVTNVILTSKPAKISVLKNAKIIDQFREDIKYRTSIINLPTKHLVTSGTTFAQGTTYLGTVTFTPKAVQTLVITLDSTKSPFNFYYNLLSVIDIISGNKVTVFIHPLIYTYGIVSSSLDSISFYNSAPFQDVVAYGDIDATMYLLN